MARCPKGRQLNISSFDFPNVPGTLVDRQQPRGRTFPIDWYFDGEDHLQTAQAFELSARDPRAWTVQHPYYGTLTVQPAELNFDNRQYNVTHVTGLMLETNIKPYPSTSPAPASQVEARTNTTVATIGSDYANTTTPTAEDIGDMQTQVTNAYNAANGLPTGINAANYRNTFNNANAAVLGATSNAQLAINSIQQLILAPARFDASVRDRFNALNASLTSLLQNVTGLTVNNKKLLFANGSTTLSAMALTLATPKTGDYPTVTSVLQTIVDFTAVYDNFTSVIGTLQTAQGGLPTSFQPPPNSMRALDELANFTLANLLNIAQNAKQQRSFVLEKDSNWIELTHRLYGIDQPNNNIRQLIEQNGVGLNEILQVRKNRIIKYFV